MTWKRVGLLSLLKYGKKEISQNPRPFRRFDLPRHIAYIKELTAIFRLLKMSERGSSHYPGRQES
jgi:hypothetical protein